MDNYINLNILIFRVTPNGSTRLLFSDLKVIMDLIVLLKFLYC
jgi:hypothetical protein